MRLVLDVTRAGELIGILPLLPPALAIALARDHRIPRTLLADAPRRHAEVDRRDAIVDALRMVLDAPRVKEEARARRPPHLGGPNDHLRRHTRDFRRILW